MDDRNRFENRGVGANTDLLALALAMGLAGGLIEGVGHMALQRLGFLDNSWYQIIWIAAFFNGLLVTAAAALLIVARSFLPDRFRVRPLIVFAVAAAASVPCTALILKQWMKPYAILFLTIGIAVAVARWFSRRPERVLRTARAGLPWLLALSLLACIGIEGGFALRERIGTWKLPPVAREAPDVLVIIIDTLRADHLSSYGYKRPTSPAIDRLAGRGTLFENAFSASSYTLPSHASILTGLYPSQHGVEWDTSHHSHYADFPNLAQVLQDRGYRTGAFSGNTFYFAREHGFGPGFLHFDDYFHSLPDMAFRTAFGGIATHALRQVGFEDQPARKRASDINRAALKWLDRDTDNPFFVVLNYIDTHDPYLPPQPYRSRFSSQLNPGGLINAEVYGRRKLSPQQIESEIEAYDGAVAFVDDQIDALITALQQRHSPRELLVVITSDHGEEFGEHGSLMHGRHLYREVIHVPLIIWQPGKVPAGKRIVQPVSNTAIPATIMNLLGREEALFPGAPLRSLWEASSSMQASTPPLSELKKRPWVEDQAPVLYGSLRSVVSSNLHYIENDGRGRELFDWTIDPLESSNLVNEHQFKATVEQLHHQLP
jgi:arylsulfatase A-like enzyme